MAMAVLWLLGGEPLCLGVALVLLSLWVLSLQALPFVVQCCLSPLRRPLLPLLLRVWLPLLQRCQLARLRWHLLMAHPWWIWKHITLSVTGGTSRETGETFSFRSLSTRTISALSTLESTGKKMMKCKTLDSWKARMKEMLPEEVEHKIVECNDLKGAFDVIVLHGWPEKA
eukprot:TRINITY_DN18497_c0_g1_i1.p3 TRINITY_DN18497_c0_g1~~TRINITY_DN18497_c0_g1_i1.p3  ORF type:complete len:171 (+),score=26.69 TRINITY_DN18497_c0_g1_i1:1313-1825(+)